MKVQQHERYSRWDYVFEDYSKAVAAFPKLDQVRQRRLFLADLWKVSEHEAGVVMGLALDSHARLHSA